MSSNAALEVSSSLISKNGVGGPLEDSKGRWEGVPVVDEDRVDSGDGSADWRIFEHGRRCRWRDKEGRRRDDVGMTSKPSKGEDGRLLAQSSPASGMKK